MTLQTLETPGIESLSENETAFIQSEGSLEEISSEAFARCIAASQRIRWDIDQDIIRGRDFNISQHYLPEALSNVDDIESLTPHEKIYLSQIQCRTYAHMFHLAERFVNAKVLEMSRDHWFGNQTALEALVRFSDEELKHQEMFRRIEHLAGALMAPGYAFLPDPNAVARAVLSKSTWAVLALTLALELTSKVHYRHSLDWNDNASPLFKDVLRYHWLEESQHVLMDQLEWERHDKAISWEARDRSVDELIELVNAVDGLLQVQAKADGEYFARTCGRHLPGVQRQAVEKGLLKAYRWQYILSGAQHPHFIKVLTSFITEQQGARIQEALAGLA